MSKTFLIIIAVAFVGYLIGKSDNNSSSYSGRTINYAPPSFNNYSSPNSDREEKLQERKEELKQKIEDARFELERARLNAEDLEHQATMRWMQTGSIGDMIRMNDAQDNLQSINNSLSNLD